MTGALWRLPPVLCGLAASEASRPVYLSVSSLLFQKGPVAPAVAVTAPQQTPVVMTPQAPAQAASQPVQPPQTGIAAAPGAPVVSQVCSLCRPAPLYHPHSTLKGAGTVTAASRLAVSQAQPRTHSLIASHSWPRTKSLTHAHTRSHSYIHTSPYQPKDIQTHTYRHRPAVHTCVYTFRDRKTHRYRLTYKIIHTEIQNTHTHLQIYRPESPHRGYSLLPMAV